MTKREFKLVGMTVMLMSIPLVLLAHRSHLLADLPSSAYDWNTRTVSQTKTGERRAFFQSPTATLDELECHASTLRPGESAHAPHQHPEEEMTIVKEGTVEVLVNGELKRVGPGSVVFQAANQLHSIKNVGTTPAVYHAIKWRSAKTAPTSR